MNEFLDLVPQGLSLKLKSSENKYVVENFLETMIENLEQSLEKIILFQDMSPGEKNKLLTETFKEAEKNIASLEGLTKYKNALDFIDWSNYQEIMKSLLLKNKNISDKNFEKIILYIMMKIETLTEDDKIIINRKKI